MSKSAELCPSCGGSEWKDLFLSRGYRIARCAGCTLVRTLNVPDSVEYPPFDQSAGLAARISRAAVAVLYRERIAIVRRAAARGRLLDFGCGSGAFARLAARSGYDVVGVEPFSLGQPEETENLRLIRAPLDECASSLGQFDVITLWQVLEHVADPRSLLKALLAHLRPGGTLIVSVPNFASWQSRMFGPGWFHLDAPRHITHFEPATLRALLDELELEVTRERTFHVEYGPAGWLQSTLNVVATRPNFLYEIVKDRGALAGVGVGEIAWNLVVSGVTGAVVAAPIFVVETVAGARGAGTVLTAVVRRRTG